MLKRSLITVLAFLRVSAAFGAQPAYLAALNQKSKELGYKVSFTQGKCDAEAQRVCDVTARLLGMKFKFMAVFAPDSDEVSHYTLVVNNTSMAMFAAYSIITSVTGGMDTKAEDSASFLVDGLARAGETGTYSNELNGTHQSFAVNPGFGSFVQVSKS